MISATATRMELRAATTTTGTVVSSWTRPDAVTLLVVTLTAALLIPSRYAFTFFAGAVTPAVLFGLGLLWLWLLGRAAPASGMARGAQPVRIAMLVLLWSGAASYAAALLRPTQAVESRSAIIGLIVLLSWVGIGLFATDGIRSLARLDFLLRLLVVGVAVVAAVGLIQYLTGRDPALSLRLPGLAVVPGGPLSFIGHRGGVRRVYGTTSHPIEFGVLMAVVLPLAIHYARTTQRGWMRRLLWVCLPVIAVGVPISVSRSAFVGLAVVGLVLAATWSWSERIAALLAGMAGALALFVFAHGLLGTVASLFTRLATDPSITHRAWDYGFAVPFITHAPLFGRGFRTLIPQLYDFVDNQYLMSLLETGVLGICALLAVFISALWVVRRARRRVTDTRTQGLIAALTAALYAAAAAFFTFDALSFPLITAVVFLLMGCSAALWRIVEASPSPVVVSPARRRLLAGVGEGLTVITVTHNSAPHLPAFFAELRQALRGIEHELVVADNNSSDDTVALIAELAPAARVVNLRQNRGYAAGINAALAASQPSEAVLILNPDVQLQHGLVPRLLLALRRDGVGIAVPRLITPDGEVVPSLRRTPTVLRALGEAILGGRLAGRVAALGEVVRDPERYQLEGFADWASGACLMVSRRCLLDVGAWDEAFFLYSEETDFMLRAKDRGWRLLYSPGALAVHTGGEAHRSPHLWSILTVNRVRLFALRHGALRTAAFWSAVVANELTRAVLGRRAHRAALGALLFPSGRRWKLTL